ncbi:MAG TPA: chromosomal replication initiator protein DnaA [Candidatus Fimadaptatus faecigallinarum]|uniref:Chromosomal replication initiator protein DnaA n=1 Tax=Candidatus Fimadaptatus faecigallinarum TaxID=2840814 RepID=A0A9D1LR52_9FIRM|nr:chromosomal replication initiator protein DnaA [Candidatus Fimadaptatus faecigallinarum]
MKPDEIDEIWKRACAPLKDALAEVSYETWIATLKPIDAVGDRFLLEASTPFHRNMITSRYSELVRNALRAATRRDYELEVYLPGETAGDKRKPEPEPGIGAYANGLNPKYTFDTFVIGNSNRFAHAASLAVAESPADAYNPLFLYGGVGLGKTHLMHAIGHYMLRENPAIKLVYITSENFTNELISAIQNNRNTEFRERFRNVDVLMVDDIQFIAGRDSTQEEFFHTFNQLHASGKQIIISSDKPPRDIPTLEERLRSRFEWGLIADIQRPDYETRIAILRKKAQVEHIDVSDDIIAFIADKIESNIRELEGSLTRIIAYASLSGKPITMAVAEEALRNILSIKDPKRITPDVITQAVSDFYGVSPEDVKSSKRNREIALPRQIAMYLTRDMTELSLPRIGDAFGGRDHTTVMHACDKISQLMLSDPALKNALAELRKTIREK